VHSASDAGRALWVAEEERLALLQRSRLLDWPPEPEFDRWTAALRRDAGAVVAALVLVDANGIVVKSLATAQGCAEETSELPLSEPLADYLVGRAGRSRSWVGTPGYAEMQVSVDGRLLGWMAIANYPDGEWRDGHLRALEAAAAGVTIEVRLRLANHAATRARDLVASHNRLHELIARGAPLSEVL
jgi:hypothetical protein